MLDELRKRLPEDEVAALASTPHLCGACEQFGSDNTVWAARLLWDEGAPANDGPHSKNST
jgi:hypothetical protein